MFSDWADYSIGLLISPLSPGEGLVGLPGEHWARPHSPWVGALPLLPDHTLAVKLPLNAF